MNDREREKENNIVKANADETWLIIFHSSVKQYVPDWPQR